ncbi:MAG: hypothetical protein JRI29_05045 [Deltaproteobacteria bacterium]|nr:hypothetical protein [Deltaproteobacteria bacterium]
MKENYKKFLCSINKRQLLIGMSSLIIGTLVYLVDRSPDQTYFVFSSPFNISLFKTLPIIFGFIGNNLPAFIHAFSFILITGALVSCRKRGYLIICLSWFFVDCVFELGQKFSSLPSKIIPDWFTGIPFLENTGNYFVHGTFDCFDLAAITMGTVIALFVLLFTNKPYRCKSRGCCRSKASRLQL